MTANIEINTARDPAIELMATVFAKPDLYIAAAYAGFRPHHLRRLPSRCREIMHRFALAFRETDDWEGVAIKFRQDDPGFFRWLDAQNAGIVDAEHITALVAELIARANESTLNASTVLGGTPSNGVEPEPSPGYTIIKDLPIGEGTGRGDTRSQDDARARDRKRSQDRKPGAWRDNLIDPQKLCDERFPEVKYVTPGIFPEGVILLASRPKLGKSWLIYKSQLR